MSNIRFLPNREHVGTNFVVSPKARRSFMYASLTMCLLLCILNPQPGSHPHRKTTLTTRGTSLLPFLGDFAGEKRPSVYTYYRHVEIEQALKNNPMLWTWAYLWAEAGYNPRVLTMDDARKHYDFAKHVVEDGLAIEHNNRVMRYLAMSTILGGGWFMEYFVFPLNPSLNELSPFALPNRGKFTAHDHHVPSILSGNQWEWTRMGHQMIKHPQNNDMSVLFEMHKENPKSYCYENSVLKFKDLNNLPPEEICKLAKSKRALRFSPEDMAESGNADNLPQNIVMKFITTYREICLKRNVPVLQPS